MKGYPGVTTATRKDGTLYYRSSITISNRHISLGSFDRLEKASAAYQTACSIMRDHQYHIPDYSPCPMKPGLSSPAAFRFCSRDHLTKSD